MSEKKERKIIKYKLEMVFGIIGGLILFLVGASGSAEFYVKLIEFGKYYFGEESIWLDYLKILFISLASLGGLTVLVGSILIGLGRRSFGSWLVDIGAGISLSIFLTKIIILGPTIQNLVQSGRAFKAFQLFGFEIGLTGLGLLFAFLGTLTNYRWMVLLFILGILAMFVGVTGNPTLIERALIKFGLSVEYLQYMRFLEGFLLYIGPILLLASLLVGANRISLAKIVVLAGLISIIPVLASTTITLIYRPLLGLSLLRTLSIYSILIGSLYFLIFGESVTVKFREKKSSKS